MTNPDEIIDSRPLDRMAARERVVKGRDAGVILDQVSQDVPNAAHNEAMGAPGEHGHYSRFSPEPVEVFWAWGLDHWQCEAIAHIVRYDEKDGRLDLEKAVWWINDLIARKYDDKAVL